MPPPNLYLSHVTVIAKLSIADIHCYFRYRLLTSTGVFFNAAKTGELPSLTADFQQYPTLTRERTKKQCTYNVTLQRVRLTIIAVETQQCILCFSTLSHLGHESVLNIKCVLIVSTAFV
jgi:hypothetical protein